MQDAHAAVTPAALDPQRLEVYTVALDFHARTTGLVPKHGQAHLRDQLARASLSIVLNIAEGAGRFSWPDKGRLYTIARGSACECGAILDVIESLSASAAECREARSLLVRIVQMLTKLVARMRTGGA
jgi:four helix bundle protein